jgi:serpin B
MDRMTALLRALFAVLLGLTACAPVAESRIAQSSLPRDTNLTLPLAGMQDLTRLNNSFGLDLYQSLRDDAGNLVFSPYSISAALAMTYAGARSTTESQMSAAVHFDLPQSELHSAFNQLDLALTQAASPTSAEEQPLQLRIANAVWVEQTLRLLDEYLDVIARNYGAGVRLADFLTAHEPARREINAWVGDQTEQRIKDLIPEGAVDQSTRMVLVNAIYFRGDWLHKFDANDTSEASFFLLDGSEVVVQMMSNDLAGAAYAAGPGYEAVELPYQGGTAAMDVIVPDAGTFEAFDTSLNSEALVGILGSLQPVSLHLELPLFNFGASFDLEEKLTALGMADAFDPDIADFSGMTGGRDLFISRVLHQAFVAVDEEGTEAAAATAVIMGPTSIMLPDLTLTVDRPFVFVIRDLGTGQILFIGRVLDPTQ